ncbi:hypothetical protein [Ruegeria sp. HKCCA0370]|uniref:hypothetical protein n=1 Tax=Ruegeria sp. HKCCA0370 TaxID=2682995 RepID=UPI001489A627|nr:hypothetical protein [Ruegeria sp. HKCCA0370]
MTEGPVSNRPSPESEMKEIWQRRVELEQNITSRISETTRYIGFGIVAWIFAVHTSSSGFATSYVESYGFFVGLAGLAGLLTIVLDYFQYIFGYRSVGIAMDNRENNYQFQEGSAAYVFQNLTWKAKQWAAGIGAITVSVTFGMHVILRNFGG